jgi:hypothetical protein
VLLSLAQVCAQRPGPPIIHHGLIKWAAYLVRSYPFQIFQIILLKTLQVMLCVCVQGNLISTCDWTTRSQLRIDAMNCFIDDPNLEGYFEPRITELCTALDGWFSTTLSMTDNPFANVDPAVSEVAPSPSSTTNTPLVPTPITSRGKKR